MQTIRKYLPGMAVCLVIAVPSWLLGKLLPVIGGPVFSIVIGMVIALFWTPGAACKPGVGFTSKKILQTAVVLLGFGLNLNVVLQTGKQSLPIIICTIATSLLVAFALHKLLHIDGNISTLIGVGSSICGGPAPAPPIPDGGDNGGLPENYPFERTTSNGEGEYGNPIPMPPAGRIWPPCRRCVRSCGTWVPPSPRN